MENLVDNNLAKSVMCVKVYAKAHINLCDSFQACNIAKSNINFLD